MRLLVWALIFVPFVTLAHQPNLVDFETYDDTVLIADATLSQAFYGELVGYPHTYQVTLTASTTLFVEVLVPDIDEADDDRSAIIVRQLPRGGVEEVARLSYQDADWESFYEPWGGDSYRRGPHFEEEVAAGSYLIEVSTANNEGKYVLVVGEEERFWSLGYFETVKRIFAVKHFYGKNLLAALQSPLITIPLVLLIGLGWYGRRWYKNRHA